MIIDLPFLAEGVEGGDVVQILVHEGDQVTEGEPLIELETEKATVPVPAPTAGKIASLLVREGDHVKVGQALVELEDSAGEAQPSISSASGSTSETGTRASASDVQSAPKGQRQSDPEQEENPPQPGSAPQTESQFPKRGEPATSNDAQGEPGPLTPKSAGSMIAAPPSIRRLARELGVTLTQVKGSEAGGRITAEDVKAYVRERTRRVGFPTDLSGQGKERNVFFTTYGAERREPVSSLRRKIASTVTQAWTTVPHVHQFQDADITDLLELHKRYDPQFKAKGAPVTLTGFFLKAVVHALKAYPQLNATLDLVNGEVIYKDYYNIGVAVDTTAGLVVPVVHHVDQKDLFQISLELADLAERTRKREIKLEELRGATFTVSNMGGLGAGPFAPIIYPPQVGIVGMGRAQVRAVYRDGGVAPRTLLPLCVAYDHRLVDGAVGARFTNELVTALEDFQATSLGL